jgi:hypothetical protein
VHERLSRHLLSSACWVCCAGDSSKQEHDKKETHKITDPKDEMSLKNRVAKEKALEKEEEEAAKQ